MSNTTGKLGCPTTVETIPPLPQSNDALNSLTVKPRTRDGLNTPPIEVPAPFVPKPGVFSFTVAVQVIGSLGRLALHSMSYEIGYEEKTGTNAEQSAFIANGKTYEPFIDCRFLYLM